MNTKYKNKIYEYRKDESHLFLLSLPGYTGKFRFGFSLNVERRLNKYQEYGSQYKLEYASDNTPYYREIHKYILDKFPNKNDWVTGNLDNIIDAIVQADHRFSTRKKIND